MIRSKYKQEIRGNPGDCYIACILYVLKRKYGIETNVLTQKDIFVKGILKAKATFFMGSLNEIAKKFSRPIQVLISNKQQVKAAAGEISSDNLNAYLSVLDLEAVEDLIDKNDYIVLSVDRYVIYPYYHDYFFVSISKKNGGYEAMEPFSGKSLHLNKNQLEEYVYSTRENLDDTAVAIVI